MAMSDHPHNKDNDNDDDVSSDLERTAHLTHCLTSHVQHATTVMSSLTTTTTTTTTTTSSGSSPSGTGGAEALTASPSSSSSSNTTTAALPSCQTSLPPDTEYATFVLQLAPRIRRVEMELIRALTVQLEYQLVKWKSIAGVRSGTAPSSKADIVTHTATDHSEPSLSSTTRWLLEVGAVIRAFMILGRGKDVERLLARLCVVPLLNLSMGRLDEGGGRGECTGLSSWLNQVCVEVCRTWGPLLRYALSVLDPHCDSLDLITGGVWVPLVSALTSSDVGIQMAIFSPGIASILQSNYTVLEKFVAHLSQRLLTEEWDDGNNNNNNTDAAMLLDTPSLSSPWEALYYFPSLTAQSIQDAQNRIYAHPKTHDFNKKWNLPIYYQLRFGECCQRLNKAIDATTKEGWLTPVFTGTNNAGSAREVGLELPLFLELYDVLLFLWRPDVVLVPLTNRLLRGATQLVGRVVLFCQDGMEGTLRFGDATPAAMTGSESGGATVAQESSSDQSGPSMPSSTTSRPLWSWAENEQDVAVVAWELHVLEMALRRPYVDAVCQAIVSPNVDEPSSTHSAELIALVTEVLEDAAQLIVPLVDSAWNDIIVKLLTAKCSGPLAVVKGVAATYRMTNRPPPTQASPFVATVLRPLKEFNQEFAKRTPDRVGARWKHQIVATVADRYAAAVEDLLATVQRTEVALSSRRARRVTSGGMSDGEKVKLQLYLDCVRFAESVAEVGVDPTTVRGLSQLTSLTAEGGDFAQRISDT